MRLVGLTLVAILGCTTQDMQPPLPPADDALLPRTELVPWLTDTGLYGYADRTGKLQIPARFAAARLFFDCVAAVRDGDWGFIDPAGKWRIHPRYQGVRDFRGGRATVYRFSSPWLGPIMHLILKNGSLSELEIDRAGNELARHDSMANAMPETSIAADPFFPRYAPPSRPQDQAGRIGDNVFEEVRTIVDANGGGTKFLAGHNFGQPWRVFTKDATPLAEGFRDVAPFASEGCFVAAPSDRGFDAYDEHARAVTRVDAAFGFVFWNGVAETYVPDVGVVFVDRTGRVYADLAYIEARHRAVGRY